MLGNGSFGVINLGLAVFSYGLIISSPGLHTIGTRIVSQRSSNDAAVIKQITALRFILALLTFAVMTDCLSLPCSRYNDCDYVVILYSASLLPFAFQIEWFYQGKQRVAALGASRATGLLSFVVLLFFIVNRESDVLLVPVVYFVNAVVNAAMLYFIYRKGKSKTSLGGRYCSPDKPSDGNRFSANRCQSVQRRSLPKPFSIYLLFSWDFLQHHLTLEISARRQS